MRRKIYSTENYSDEHLCPQDLGQTSKGPLLVGGPGQELDYSVGFQNAMRSHEIQENLFALDTLIPRIASIVGIPPESNTQILTRTSQVDYPLPDKNAPFLITLGEMIVNVDLCVLPNLE